MITNRLTGAQETLASTGGSSQWQVSGGVIYDGGISELSPFTNYRQLKIGVTSATVQLSLSNLTTFSNDGDLPFVFLFFHATIHLSIFCINASLFYEFVKINNSYSIFPFLKVGKIYFLDQINDND
jgi:hypothetical protein